jgi:hypothetical protein
LVVEALARTNLDILQKTLGAEKPKDELICGLWESCLAGEGRAIKATPLRTVFQASFASEEFVLKICHPQRPGDLWRNLIRKPPAIREGTRAREFAKLFGKGAESFATAVGEQVTASFGLAARPWLDGISGRSISPEALGQGLAKLHEIGWRDADVSPQDLLYVENQTLLPLDFGQTRFVRPNHQPSMEKDLLRLLTTFSNQEASLKGPTMVQTHAEILGCNWDTELLLAKARKIRLRTTWRQSGICLRESEDFEKTKFGFRRRHQSGGKEFSFVAPSGRLAYRRFFWLEQLHIPVPHVVSYRKEGSAEVIAMARFPDGEIPVEAQLQDLREHLCIQGLDLKPFLADDFRLQGNRPILVATERLIRLKAGDLAATK